MSVQSLPTTYGGVPMRSLLEGKWAAWFDRYDVPWGYEPDGGFQFDDGTQYRPDFYLPECRTWVEVKGVFREKDRAKLYGLTTAAAERDQMVVIACAPAGQNFALVTPSVDQWLEGFASWHLGFKREIALARCYSCRRPYFVDLDGYWQCRVCKHYNGSLTFEALVTPCGGGLA